MSDSNLFKELSKVYYDESHPASYGGAEKLYDAVKQIKGSNIKKVKEWLSSQLTYSLHKPIRKRFKRNPTVVNGIDDQWQADLVDVKEFATHNNGYKYLITIIDIFSKYAFVFPTKTKTMNDVLAGFKIVFQSRKPIKIQTDQGKEFDNRTFRNFLKDENVLYYTTRNTEIKCSIVERFNRTLRGRMFRYFTKHGTRKYIGVLDNIVTAYNKTVHRSTGLAPCKVTDENSPKVFKALYGFKSVRDLLKAKYKSAPKLEVNDSVRIQNHVDAFTRGYHPQWTNAYSKCPKQ